MISAAPRLPASRGAAIDTAERNWPRAIMNSATRKLERKTAGLSNTPTNTAGRAGAIGRGMEKGVERNNALLKAEDTDALRTALPTTTVIASQHISCKRVLELNVRREHPSIVAAGPAATEDQTGAMKQPTLEAGRKISA